ncbi:galactosyltransferase-related protein [Streptomyces sp. NPDC102274]|uniref:galactosyltransferase-related protein n=1 Tax=Streptomyces sp. NPDC102274 TaxID=3366151 RepID=UPI00381D143D
MPFTPQMSTPHKTVASLAERLTAYAVLAHDLAVPQIAADYWAKSEDHYRAVDAALADLVTWAPQALGAYKQVLADPTHTGAQHTLREHLIDLLTHYTDQQAGLADVVTEADRHIWVDYHLGADYTAQAPKSALAVPVTRARTEDSQVHVVIPFHDHPGGLRTRNLLACLYALADQEGGPAYRVTVVETDIEPRTRAALEGAVDDYVFAYKDGLFNKAWAVNVGVVEAGADAMYTCILDADILVDRHFVASNAARLSEGGHGTHLPFRWSLSLDEPSTQRALTLRTREGIANVPGSVLRGLLLREPPGGCVWLRTKVLHAVGGFDERYEGWGGEDDDVIARLAATAPLVRYDDALLHLNHPRPAMTRDDGAPFNNHIEPLSWTGADGYGDQLKFSVPTA